ncbi:hypothetical protein MNB_SM-6-820 [hydrothermal vent metagenome]|uniref:Uncharacterized protein n=1 Tax=hydrothermal vent metagenome TaxID=652676 RepID=A0A1W1CJU9_9ZZZZ
MRLKNIFKLTAIALLMFSLGGCGGGGSTDGGNSTNSGGNSNNNGGGAGGSGNSNGGGGSNTGGSGNSNAYSYIPKGNALTDRMAVRFLDMATMGSTPQSVQKLRQKGVVQWVDDQLAKQWNFKKESIVYNLMTYALKMRPYYYCKKRYNLPIPTNQAEIDDLINKFLADDDIVFNRGLIHGGDELDYHSSAILTDEIEDDAQLRQRVAYALSQIIVASESTDFFFKNRGEALSYYYDILLKGAFGNYGDILYNVSLSPAMATYLTYANNRKAYIDKDTNQTIYPDENYGREIMQLFSVGLYKLNMDGTEQRVSGKRVPTYGQKDVMEMSRVFTGMTYPNHIFKSKKDPSMWISDVLHPLTCNNDYHDDKAKQFLGKSLPKGQSCFKDVKGAIDILMQHQNTAPFIAKKLIMRLTKSNPKTDYIKRVAEVFKESGGDLGKTVRAVLLDEEIWDDIKNDHATKIKEPYLTYINMLRAFNVKPWPERTTTDDDGTKRSIKDRYYVRSRYQYLGQWPTYAPTVFNFYNDTYQPDISEFKIRGYVAPEAQILTTKYMMGIANNTCATLKQCEYHYIYANNGKKLGRSGQLFHTYMLLDFGNYTEYFKRSGKQFQDGPRDASGREDALRKVIEDASERLMGKQLDQTFVKELVDSYKDELKSYASSWDNDDIQKYLVSRIIAPVITEIVMSKEFMTH